MTGRRILADAIRELPGGLDARPMAEGDLAALTTLIRACDVAGCGHSATNLDEIRDELSDPDCDWDHGCATVWRDTVLVGALRTFDGLARASAWVIDVQVRPGDPRATGIQDALIDSALREGRSRWGDLPGTTGPATAVAKSGAYANDGALQGGLARRGFQEVRRFLRMQLDHWSVADALAPPGGPTGPVAPSGGSAADPGVPQPPAAAGYVIRPFVDVEADWHAMHELNGLTFLDHFDFTLLDFDDWRGHLQGSTEDTSQWLIVEQEGQPIGYARGSNKYASEESGYVASIGVLPEHRGHGVASALLRARFADDIARGFLSTFLHVDADNTTGATRLYEAVGMSADSEWIAMHRHLFDGQ